MAWWGFGETEKMEAVLAWDLTLSAVCGGLQVPKEERSG